MVFSGLCSGLTKGPVFGLGAGIGCGATSPPSDASNRATNAFNCATSCPEPVSCPGNRGRVVVPGGILVDGFTTSPALGSTVPIGSGEFTGPVTGPGGLTAGSVVTADGSLPCCNNFT